MYNINLKNIEKINKCPSCKSNNFKKITEVYFKNKFCFFSTSFCKSCSLIFRSRRPNEKWFLKNWNLRHNIQKAKSINFLNPRIEIDRKKRYGLILDDIIKKNQRILDIGCGPGTGLKKYATKNIIDGIEPDITRAKVAKKNKVNVYNCSLEEFYKKEKVKYDLVIFFHTLEHMFYPRKTIYIIQKLLKRDGKLVIEVPNFIDWVDSWHDSLYLAHMQNFSLYSLTKLMIRNNFFPTKVFFTKYKDKERNICAIFKKKIIKKKESYLFKILKKSFTHKEIKKIYNPVNNKVFKINVDKINDLSLTYKPTEKIHQNIIDNILERKLRFNNNIKKYEVFGNELKMETKKFSKNNYKKYLDDQCIKINKFLKKINND